MQKNDWLIIFLALFLLLAMLLTFIFGGEKSRHGYGASRRSPVKVLLHTTG